MQFIWLKIVFRPLAYNDLSWFLSAVTLRLDGFSTLLGSSSAYLTCIPQIVWFCSPIISREAETELIFTPYPVTWER